MNGVRYILFIVDDYFRKLWVYLLKNRNEVVKKFESGFFYWKSNWDEGEKPYN